MARNVYLSNMWRNVWRIGNKRPIVMAYSQLS